MKKLIKEKEVRIEELKLASEQLEKDAAADKKFEKDKLKADKQIEQETAALAKLEDQKAKVK